MAQLCSADTLVVPAVSETLDALDLTSKDAAAARLAEVYARQLDQAAGMAAHAERVLRMVDGDPELAELVSALKAKLSVQVTLATIGPKLLDALTSLGATPKARASLPKGGPARGGALAAVRSTRGA